MKCPKCKKKRALTKSGYCHACDISFDNFMERTLPRFLERQRKNMDSAKKINDINEHMKAGLKLLKKLPPLRDD